jgi:hypothetical protein
MRENRKKESRIERRGLRKEREKKKLSTDMKANGKQVKKERGKEGKYLFRQYCATQSMPFI